MSLLELPSDLIIELLRHCAYPDLLSVARTSRRLRTLCDEERIWTEQLRRRHRELIGEHDQLCACLPTTALEGYARCSPHSSPSGRWHELYLSYEKEWLSTSSSAAEERAARSLVAWRRTFAARQAEARAMFVVHVLRLALLPYMPALKCIGCSCCCAAIAAALPHVSSSSLGML